VGRVNNELGFGGLVISASSQNVNLLIRALQESQRIEVLSRPQVRTLDNQPAYIQVGQRVPQITSSSITQFGQTNAIAFSDVGLILGVTPRISPDNTVVMEIDAEKSSVAAQDGVPISALADGTVIRAPIFNSTRAQSTVSAASGETIVLAGLITKDNATIDRGVPYLSDLPLLGNLFRYDSSNSVRTELLIILTPHIIRGQEDSERVKQAELARMSWCAADVYEVHGDINYNFEDQSMMLEEEAVETIYPDQEGFPATDQPLVSPGVIQNASAGLRRPAPTAPRRPAPAEVRVAGRRKR
jgi:type II secretory pathway component GspD/PulD (secretin)